MLEKRSDSDELKLFIERTIKEAHIPNGVSAIGTFAFNRCMSLENVTISESVNDIDNYAFFQCRSLEKVIFRGTPVSIDDKAIYNIDEEEEIDYDDIDYAQKMNIYVPYLKVVTKK